MSLLPLRMTICWRMAIVREIYFLSDRAHALPIDCCHPITPMSCLSRTFCWPDLDLLQPSFRIWHDFRHMCMDHTLNGIVDSIGFWQDSHDAMCRQHGGFTLGSCASAMSKPQGPDCINTWLALFSYPLQCVFIQGMARRRRLAVQMGLMSSCSCSVFSRP